MIRHYLVHITEHTTDSSGLRLVTRTASCAETEGPTQAIAEFF